MKIMIDIPKEFETDLQDKFQDFFSRVKVEIEHRLATQDILMCGNYERETAEMFLSAFEKATVIPDDAEDKSISLEKVKKAREEISTQFVDLQDGSEEWRSYVNETVFECVEILDQLIESEG